MQCVICTVKLSLAPTILFPLSEFYEFQILAVWHSIFKRVLVYLFPQITCSNWNLFSQQLAYWLPSITLAFFIFECNLTPELRRANRNMLDNNSALWMVAKINEILWKTCLAGPPIYLFIYLFTEGWKNPLLWSKHLF